MLCTACFSELDHIQLKRLYVPQTKIRYLFLDYVDHPDLIPIELSTIIEMHTHR